MPESTIYVYRDSAGRQPFLKWLDELHQKNSKAYERCVFLLEQLAAFGHELRRPTADYLRDGVYELRVRHRHVNYRILYGFVGKDVVLISHGFTKEKKVPAREIDIAASRLDEYEQAPERHTAWEESNDA